MLVHYVYVVLMALFNLQQILAANMKRSPYPASDAIMYPGPAKVDPDAGVPEECRGKSYCTVKPPDYPQEKFDKMFKDFKRPSSAMNLQPALVTDPTINNRQGDPDEIDQCLSKVSFEPLFQVKDKLGEWRTVIQVKEHDYVQRVRLETCNNPGGSCFNKVFAKNGEYETFCKQKENTWEVVVDGKDGPETIKTELPVCCSCHYRSINLASRFGGKEKTSPASASTKKL